MIKLKFLLPKKTKFLYFGKHSLDGLQEILKLNLNSYSIIDNRKNEINVLVALISIVKFFFARKRLNDSLYLFYLVEYIKFVKPKYILNFLDNDTNYYKIKKYKIFSKLISIQNGKRSSLNDIFGDNAFYLSKDLSCDYFFVFNKFVKEKYQKKIKSKYIILGSIKNNYYKKLAVKNFDTIIYISQFRKSRKVKIKNKNVNLQNWHEQHEKVLLKNILRFCEKKKLKLKILPSKKFNSKDSCHEKKYYKKIICSNNWEILKNTKNSYQLLDKFKYITNSNSTLGLEAFARGKRVGFFSKKNFYNTEKDSNFGWPYSLPDKGYFYSNKNSYSEVSRVLNYLIRVKDSEWDVLNRRFKKYTIEFNSNKKLFEIFL